MDSIDISGVNIYKTWCLREESQLMPNVIFCFILFCFAKSKWRCYPFRHQIPRGSGQGALCRNQLSFGHEDFVFW